MLQLKQQEALKISLRHLSHALDGIVDTTLLEEIESIKKSTTGLTQADMTKVGPVVEALAKTHNKLLEANDVILGTKKKIVQLSSDDRDVAEIKMSLTMCNTDIYDLFNSGKPIVLTLDLAVASVKNARKSAAVKELLSHVETLRDAFAARVTTYLMNFGDFVNHSTFNKASNIQELANDGTTLQLLANTLRSSEITEAIKPAALDEAFRRRLVTEFIARYNDEITAMISVSYQAFTTSQLVERFAEECEHQTLDVVSPIVYDAISRKLYRNDDQLALIARIPEMVYKMCVRQRKHVGTLIMDAVLEL